MSDVDIWKQKTLDYGARIAALLMTDAKSFIKGRIRARFIESPAFADALSDEQLASLKAGSEALGESQAALVGSILTPAAWLSTNAAEKETPISTHPQVATAISGLEGALQAFLEKQGFPAGEVVSYRLPARFIDGETLPSLSRQYWRSLAEWRRLETAVAVDQSLDQAETRRSRWDDA